MHDDLVASRPALPAAPGTYVLVFRLNRAIRLDAGALEPCELTPGTYVYVGSAHGAGGLRARVLRHCRAGKPMRWHVDYLTARQLPMMVVWEASDLRHECEWVHRLLQVAGACAPIQGFGSSDCRAGCLAHLLKLSALVGEREIRKLALALPRSALSQRLGNQATG
jgi:Uri superfamily endonuclease